MQGLITNAVFISDSEREYTNKETGEVRTYCKAVFVQDGSADAVEMTIDDSLFGQMEKFQTYNLDLEINFYNKRFSCKVVGYAECA